MKNGSFHQADAVVDRFTVVDKLDHTNVIAVREKASVQIDENHSEVKMHDFIYTFEEIIAVAEKLKTL